MHRRDTPPVVRKDVEDAENEDKEACRPLGLEADCNHAASSKSDDRNKDTPNAPLTLENETEEEEDKEDATGKEEAKTSVSSQ